MRFHPTTAQLPSRPRVSSVDSLSRVASAAERRTSKGRKHSFTSAIRSVRGKGVARTRVVSTKGLLKSGEGLWGSGERRNKNIHGASRRAIGRALPCRRIITCTLRAPWQRGVGTLRVRSARIWPRPRAPVWIFFLPRYLRAARRPNFVYPPRSPPLCLVVFSRDRSEVISRARPGHGATFCRRFFAFLSAT